MRGIKVFSVIILIMLTGCAAGNDNQAREENNTYVPQNVGYRSFDRELGNDETDHQYQRLEGNRGTLDNDNRDNIFRTADEAANRVADLEEIKSATVIVTNRNAYVAAILEEGNEQITSEVERKISESVTNTDAYIKNVYVSTNPGFIDQMEDYNNKLESGEPIEGIFDEFNEMIRRVFPTER